MISAGIKQLKDKLGNAIAPITHEKAIVMTEGGTLGDKLTAIDSGISSVEQKAIATLTHSKSGTVHALTGLSGKTGLVSVKFKAVAAFAAGDSFKVDGVTYTAKQANGKALAANQFTTGALVDCLVDTAGKVVNFKSGGVDVSAATARESDMLAGETFYAGCDEVRTGTLEPYYRMDATQIIPPPPADVYDSVSYITCGFMPVLAYIRSDEYPLYIRCVCNDEYQIRDDNFTTLRIETTQKRVKLVVNRSYNGGREVKFFVTIYGK